MNSRNTLSDNKRHSFEQHSAKLSNYSHINSSLTINSLNEVFSTRTGVGRLKRKSLKRLSGRKNTEIGDLSKITVKFIKNIQVKVTNQLTLAIAVGFEDGERFNFKDFHVCSSFRFYCSEIAK